MQCSFWRRRLANCVNLKSESPCNASVNTWVQNYGKDLLTPSIQGHIFTFRFMYD
ncbi:hypothetical protein E2C01_095620 [Portunus trituberculatus]|uniref:Uncharacterized protein n=1 Tax=Portunus trituberculatus TaxID=210409 RepID=A0A5B7K0L9_PORTR|nr:hypothetical protein [Portunus trituberculatus]